LYTKKFYELKKLFNRIIQEILHLSDTKETDSHFKQVHYEIKNNRYILHNTLKANNKLIFPKKFPNLLKAQYEKERTGMKNYAIHESIEKKLLQIRSFSILLG